MYNSSFPTKTDVVVALLTSVYVGVMWLHAPKGVQAFLVGLLFFSVMIIAGRLNNGK